MTYFNYVPVATAARKTVAQKKCHGFPAAPRRWIKKSTHISPPLPMPQGHPKNIITLQKHHLLTISMHIGMCLIFFGCSWGPASGELIWVDILIPVRRRQKTPGNLRKKHWYLVFFWRFLNYRCDFSSRNRSAYFSTRGITARGESSSIEPTLLLHRARARSALLQKIRRNPGSHSAQLGTPLYKKMSPPEGVFWRSAHRD